MTRDLIPKYDDSIKNLINDELFNSQMMQDIDINNVPEVAGPSSLHLNSPSTILDIVSNKQGFFILVKDYSLLYLYMINPRDIESLTQLN
jgi:hypothetical protein